MARENKTAALVRELVQPICDESGLILWDVLFVKEGASWFLRVIIDKESGVSFDDCEHVSRKLDKLLDERDPIPQAYFLEVGSPGIGRALTKDWHFENYRGREVVVKTIRPVDGVREFTGELLGWEEGNVEIKEAQTGEVRIFEKGQLASVKAADDMEF